mmetsp:Transcript_92059/g.260592  ORF Transcript_92059/g.260592 Transcript_92059/m.260592 type:complete len:294 (-) Transcript_92059:86-967(-)
MQLALLFAGHAVCSSTLTLLNKGIAVTVHAPWLVVLLQCAGSAVCSLIIDTRLKSMRRIELRTLLPNVWIAFLFTLCLVSSISTLRRVHVPMAVVGKNLTPFLTAMMEVLLPGSPPLSSQTLIGLIIGTLGGIIYLIGDANTTAYGILLCVLNAFVVALTAISEKRVTTKKEQSPLGLCFLRNALAVPFLAVFVCADYRASYAAWHVLMDARPLLYVQMLLTAFISAISGMFLFHLQLRVTATTTQVASLCYKLATTLMSLLLFPASLNDIGLVAFSGYALSTLSISIYMFSK